MKCFTLYFLAISKVLKVSDILSSTYEIDVAGVKIAANVSIKPVYDPKSERVKV